MKKTFAFIILSYLLLPCFSQEYKIIQTNEYGSCADYAIYQKVDLPETIKQALECPPWVDIQGDFLTTVNENEVLMYNFNTKQLLSLFSLYDDIDGISAPAWSPEKDKIMFVIINQNMTHNYKAFARIIVLTFDENYNKIILKEKFDRPVNFSCGSICSSMPGEDFYFVDNSTIEFVRNENIEERPGVKEKIILQK
ncbi:MAG: hypothetical protein JXL97_07810 [Bacteroidales bacterium]|nr:hypothetical protein [Bacteroidales bacterium]